MPALYVIIPLALLLVAAAIYVFFWAVDSGQYDDLDSPAHSILFDDQDPNHTAGVEEASGHQTLKQADLHEGKNTRE
jgi:cbb3-type cytochrome oxidase maturation protein